MYSLEPPASSAGYEHYPGIVSTTIPQHVNIHTTVFMTDYPVWLPFPVYIGSDVFSFDDITRTTPYTSTTLPYTSKHPPNPIPPPNIPPPVQSVQRASGMNSMTQAVSIGKALLCGNQKPIQIRSIADSLILEDVDSRNQNIANLDLLSANTTAGLSESLLDILDDLDVVSSPFCCNNEVPGLPLSEKDADAITTQSLSSMTVNPLTKIETTYKRSRGRPRCEICNKSFANRAVLRDHLNVHSGAKPYRCPHCVKTFRHSSSLRSHLRIHTKEKPYSCPVCSRAFADYSTWRTHCRLHKGEKPYVCEICGKGFAQSCNRNRHRLSHRQYMCLN